MTDGVDDDSVTVTLDIVQELLEAMELIRRDQTRGSRATDSQRVKPGDESPAEIISALLHNAYGTQLVHKRGGRGGGARYSRE